MKTSLLQKLLCLIPELLYIPGWIFLWKSGLMFLLRELLYGHIQEGFPGVFLSLHTLTKPLSLVDITFSDLILMMALSLLWFQLLQPLRRLFFWPKIKKNPTLHYLILKTHYRNKKNYTISPTALERLNFFHQKEFLHLCGPAVSPVLLLHAGGQQSATGSAELQLWLRWFEQLSRTQLTRALRHLSFPQLGLKSKDKELLFKAAFRYFF